MFLGATMKNTLEAVLASKGPAIHYVVPEAKVIDAVRTMNQERIGAVLVCVSGEMVGIFTERDVLCRVVDEGRDPTATKVVEVMTSEVVAVRPSTLVEEAMAVISRVGQAVTRKNTSWIWSTTSPEHTPADPCREPIFTPECPVCSE